MVVFWWHYSSERVNNYVSSLIWFVRQSHPKVQIKSENYIRKSVLTCQTILIPWTSSSADTSNLFTAPACTVLGLKSGHIHACRQYIRWSYNNSAFSSCAFWYLLSSAVAKWGKSHLNGFTFGVFISRFSSDLYRCGKHGSERVNMLFVCLYS